MTVRAFKFPGFCLTAVVVASSIVSAPVAHAAPTRPQIRTFVTASYPNGIAYAEARSYGSAAVPELVAMLDDRGLEEHWTRIVWTLGCIGDPSAIPALAAVLERQKGELSVYRFRAVLAVLPALGMIAQSGDPNALALLRAYTNPNHWLVAGLFYGYQHYRGAALGEVLSRTAMQGLGVSGRREARELLDSMNRNANLRADWRDNVDEALQINRRVHDEGAARVFAAEN